MKNSLTFFVPETKTSFVSIIFPCVDSCQTKKKRKKTQISNSNIEHTKLKQPRTASVELELSANVASSQNLLFDASTSSAVNDLQGIASSFGVNNTTTSSFESPSIVSSVSGQQQAAGGGGKKESHLFGWFASSTSTSASSAAPNVSATSTSSSATTASPQTITNRSNVGDDTANGQDGASSPSTKISSKLSYGEMFKFNKNGNKATALEQQTVDPPPPGASKEQQKSSRRTSSLLNLFMSNSQGKHSNHIYMMRKTKKLRKTLIFADIFVFDFICHYFVGF